jgi:hypothetical protein
MTRPTDKALEARGRLVRPAPRWIKYVAFVLAAVITLLSGLILSFNQLAWAVERSGGGVPEQILGVLAGASAKIVRLTGRSGASVRLVYDPNRSRGALVVVRLPAQSEEITYRVWLVGREGTARKNVAVFQPAMDRETVVSVKADFSRYEAVEVTVERASRAGLPKKTTTILRGTLK